MFGLTTRANIGIITAGSIRFILGRSKATRSRLVYVGAKGGVSSPSHVRCARRRCLGDRRRVLTLFPSRRRTVTGSVRVIKGVDSCDVSHSPILPEFRLSRSFVTRVSRRLRGCERVVSRKHCSGGKGCHNSRFYRSITCLYRVYCVKTRGECKRALGRRRTREVSFRLGAVYQVKFPSCFLVIRSCVTTTQTTNNVIKPNHNSTTNSMITCYLKVAGLSPVGCSLLFREFLGPSQVDVPSVSISFRSLP